MEELFQNIRKFQNKYDSNFKTLPVDNHSALIFNFGTYVVKFIFSTKELRRRCLENISNNSTVLYDYFEYVIEQEDGLTYYKLRGL